MNYDINIAYDENTPELLADFLNYLSTIRGKSPNTIEGYRIDIMMFLRFMAIYKGKVPKNIEFNEINLSFIDENFMNGIKLSDLYAFISFAEKQRENGTYARARKVASLKSFFNFLSGSQGQKVVKNNPAKELETPKLNKRHPVYLTLDESIKLLNSMDRGYKFYNRDYCMITIFLNCGVRVSELCGINISKIKGDTLTIIGKGNKERTVYLNEACIKALSTYIMERKELKNISEADKDALFISSKGTRINKRSVERIVKKYTVEAGLTEQKYTPHKLRHTAATLMYKHGNVDIRSLQSILGHDSISTTQIYTHVDDEVLREAVKQNPLSKL